MHVKIEEGMVQQKISNNLMDDLRRMCNVIIAITLDNFNRCATRSKEKKDKPSCLWYVNKTKLMQATFGISMVVVLIT
jgi:hypothetical protein